MSASRLRAQRAKLIEDARRLANGGRLSAEDSGKFDSIMAESDRLAEQINREESDHARFALAQESLRERAERSGTSVGILAGEGEDEAATFRNFLRGGFAALDDDGQREIYKRRFRAAQNTNSDPSGGYLVPTSFYQQITDAQKAFGGMINVATVIQTDQGNALPMPTDNDTANEGAIIGQNTQVSTQDIAFGAVTLNAYTYTSKLILVSNELLQDGGIDIAAFLATKLGTRIARVTNRHFTTGTGASQPTGIMNAAALGYTAGGSSSSGSVTTVSYDDLIELEHSVDPAYRQRARFMLSDATLKNIKKLKDGIGRPLWASGIAAGAPDTIDGYPYLINQSMDSPAASAKTIAFGDLPSYYIRRVTGTRVLRLTERYADFNQTGFLAFERWDGNLVDAGTHPVKYLQQAAS